MSITKNIAKLFNDVYFGGNWTAVNLKDVISDVNWEKASTRISDFNTIALLVFHMNYYVRVMTKVLNGEKLNASDKFSFDMPEVKNDADWKKLLESFWSDARTLTEKIEKLPENKLWETFIDEKYGNYYRNLHGIIEHNHYHLGQIVLIKKLILQK